MKNKVLVLILILILCGCSDKECIESHEEETVCVRYQTFPSSGGQVKIYPMYYPCTKTICDEWEVINENN